tara:strand:+ start:2395 stop:2967 length:573 start_codon:yes stop_codon:yes gene_type:complete
VGRGPWAGPVIAAACHFPNIENKHINFELFDDSKKLSPKKRKDSYMHLLDLHKRKLVKFQIGISSVKEIDNLNILQASLLAMKRALIKISYNNYMVLIDGVYKPNLRNLNCKTIIRGDQKFISIAAASIIAKVQRDQIMQNIAKKYPNYGWQTNMGYGTKEHINAIKSVGICKHHRKTFKPIKSFIHNKL